MKVILVTHGKVNPKGHNGISRVVYYTTKYLRKNGVDCEIWSVVDGIDKETIINRGEGVNVRCFPRVKLSGEKSDICKKLIKEKDSIDLVHFHMPWLMDKLPVAKVCRENEIPYVVTGHSAYNYNQKQSWKMKLGRLYEIPFLNKATAMHAITSDEKQHFKEYGIKTDAFVVSNSVEDNSNKLNKETRKRENINRFLFMGEIRPQKNIIGLVEALSLLDKEIRDSLKIDIVGPDSNGEMKRCLAKAEQLDVKSNFNYHGAVFDSERYDYFGNADVYITPSLSDVISLSAIEAMSYGIPEVATKQSDVSSLADEGFLVICDNSPKELARGIAEMIDKKSDWAKMGENARKTYEKNFMWDSNILKLIDNYKRIING